MSKLNYILPAIIVFGLAFYVIRKIPKFSGGQEAPNFSAKTLYGEDFSLSKFEGQFVLLDFWGSWCPPCRKENPELVNLYNKHNGKKYKQATNFQIVSIAVETNKRAWENAIQRDGLVWKHHISTLKRFKDPIVEQYGVKEIPTKYFVGPDFKIIGVNWTVDEIDKYLTKQIIQ